MYANKLAVAVKVNNRILRENKDTVLIPFGSEYSLLLKNLNTKRAILNIFVDGANIVPNGLVLNAGQEIDLERSIVNNNLNKGNKFKFIERTRSIEDHRGVKLEDGLIRIEFQFEQVYNYNWNTTVLVGNQQWNDYHPTWTTSTGSIPTTAVRGMATNAVYASSATLNSFNDAGITVPGGLSEQKFSTVSSFALEAEKHSMILRLLGETANNRPVTAAVTVKHRVKCSTCGTQNKSHAKFCNKCGTALELFA